MTAPAIVYPPAVIKGSTFLQTVKFWIVHHVGLEKDALHIYFALFLLFGSVMLLRWSIRGWKPYALIFAIAVVGEIWDMRDGLLTRVPLVVSLPDSIHDIWNTMFWPLAILLLARFTDVFGVRRIAIANDLPVENGTLPIANHTSQPLTVFVEIECATDDIPPGGKAIVTLSEGIHSLEIYEGQVTVWHNGGDLATIAIVGPEDEAEPI